MNRDVCEHFNPVDLPCDKCKPANVQKSTLREAAQQALEALKNIDKEFSKHGRQHWPEAVKARAAIAPLRAALAEPMVPSDCPDSRQPAALLTTWVSETEAVTEPLYKGPRRLTDSEISEVWFQAKITGLTETSARLLIRAAERRMGAG